MLDESAYTFLPDAKASKSLTSMNPFVTGARFKVTGYEYTPFDPDKTDTRFYPSFKTSLGSLGVKSLVAPRSVVPYKVDDKEVTFKLPNGTFNQLLRKLLLENAGKTSDEVLPILVDKVKDLDLIVKECEIVRITTKFGGKDIPLLHIDIVVK